MLGSIFKSYFFFTKAPISVLVVFPVAVIKKKYPGKSNIKEKMFILAHGLKVKLTKFGKSKKQVLEASGKIAFTVKKRVINVYAISLSPFILSRLLTQEFVPLTVTGPSHFN